MKEQNKNNRQCRVIKNKNFTVMSNIHLQAKNISLKAKGLMSLCLSLPDNWDYSIAGLVTLSTDGRDSVTTALRELEKNGYLTIEKNKDSKGFFTSFYTFYENPSENALFNKDGYFIRDGFSDTDNPMQIARCSSTAAEKPEQINTNKKDTKNKITNNKKNILGEFENIYLTDSEETKLKDLYKSKFEEAVGKLSSYKQASGKKYKSDYAVLNKHNWVYKSIFPINNNVREFPIRPENNQGKYSNCYN